MSLVSFTRTEDDLAFLKPVVGTAWTKNNSPAYATGYFGNGLSIGDTSYALAEVPTHTKAITGANLFTIEFWFKPAWNSGTVARSIINDNISGNSNDIASGTDGKITCYLFNPYPTNGILYVFNSPSFVAGTWYRVAFVVDNSLGNGERLSLYVNGTEIGVSSYTHFGTGITGNINLTMFGVLRSYAVMDNIKIYNHAKRDFLDMFDERGGLNDQIMIG